jgi:hypothetical protein
MALWQQIVAAVQDFLLAMASFVMKALAGFGLGTFTGV